jgi:2-aminobenzoate-CoA ligase
MSLGPLPSAHGDTFARDHLPPAELWPELRFDLGELQYPDRLNCAEELLRGALRRFGADRPCLLSETETWTYGEVDRRSDQVARVLVEELGLIPGNRVLLCGPNSPWLAVCWLGVLKAGGVAVTVVPLLRAEELATVVDIAEVGFAICAASTSQELAKAELDGRVDVVTVLYGGTESDDLVARCDRLDAKPFPAVQTSADDVALIAFTSGTTGRPKGCTHLHRDVLAIADTFSRHVLKPTEDDVFTGSPPLGFTFGLGGLVIFPLRAGASTLLLERGSPDALVAAIERHRVSVLFTAPTAYRAMLAGLAAARSMGVDAPEPRAAFPSLRRCVSAGEALPVDTWHAWHEATGIKIIDGIGATELLHIFISSSDDDIHPGSTGRPVPGWQAAVLDQDGRPVPDGEPGLLAVRGPVGCRYLADERQRHYVRHGWNFTGDTYIRDSEGYFWYQARSDDMIISSGYNIAGPEVENALLRHPSVVETGVIGVPDPDRGQLVTALVVLRPGVPRTDETVRELQDFVKERIAPYKYPRLVRFVDALPRTATGKLQRFRLRDLV